MALILPQGKQQYFSNAGLPLVGGKLYTYAAGTNTPKTTWADAGQVAANTNPIILDSRGEALVYWDAAAAYKVQLQDALGNVLWTVDNLSAPSSSTSAGSVTVVTGDGVTDNTAAVQAAVAVGKPILFVGISVISSPTSITVPLVDTMAQIFTTSSLVTIDNGLPVRPEWWGSATGNIRLAVNALPITGGVVKLADRRYPPSYDSITAAKVIAGTAIAGVDYLSKQNVRIVGEALPTYNSAMTGLENGTIIDGPFAVQANGFSIDLVGVDSGSAVCTSRYAGVAQEGLLMLQTNQAAPFFVGQVQVGRVRAICQAPTSLVHGILMEAIDGLSVQFAEGAYGYHGTVIKCRRATIDTLSGFETGGESVIFKSDSYASLEEVQVDKVLARSRDGVQDTGFGVLIEAVTAAGGSVQIGQIRTHRKSNGTCIRSNGASLSDVRVGSIISDFCPIGLLLTGDVRRIAVGEAIINNSTSGVQVDATVTYKSNSIGELHIGNAVDGISLAGQIEVGEASFDGITNLCVNYTATTGRLVMGGYRVQSAPAFWPLQPALAGTWVNEGTAGNPQFRVTLDSNRVKVSGFIKSGGTSTVVSGFSVQIRPSENLTFVCAGFNGATLVPVTVQVTTTGDIVIPNYASAPTYISLDGVEWPIPT